MFGMTDKLAIDGVLRSLPPSFKNYVRDYVMRGDSITFCEFVSQLRHVKVEPQQEKYSMEKVYFDILVIDV